MTTRATILAAGTALCCALAAPAWADVTYTWDTLSHTGLTQGFSLSFSVSSAISIAAGSGFAGADDQGQPPNPQVAYQFPTQLTAFTLADQFPVTLADFLSPRNADQINANPSNNEPGQPEWSFDLTADPATLTANLQLFWDGEQMLVNSPTGQALFSTSQASTIDFTLDGSSGGTITGELVASDPPAPAPEPSSAWLLLSGISFLGVGGAVIRMSGARAAARRCPMAAG